jgi:hypothetical protein
MIAPTVVATAPLAFGSMQARCISLDSSGLEVGCREDSFASSGQLQCYRAGTQPEPSRMSGRRSDAGLLQLASAPREVDLKSAGFASGPRAASRDCSSISATPAVAPKFPSI